MTRRPAKSKAMTRLLGHALGISGVIMGANVVTSAINPYAQAIPTGIEQGSAVLVSIGFIALGLWLVSTRPRTPRPGPKPR